MVFQGGTDLDPRNHKSFLIPGFENECLAMARPDQRKAVAALLWEAETFRDEELARLTWRVLALQANEKGRRVEIMRDVAMHDQAPVRVESEAPSMTREVA